MRLSDRGGGSVMSGTLGGCASWGERDIIIIVAILILGERGIAGELVGQWSLVCGG